jgi:DNA replication protein DnaC
VLGAQLQRRLSMAMTIAHFPFVHTLEGFEFEAQPSIDPAKIRDLATCRWLANGDNVVLLGPPSVGKTHLEVALGREAVSRGYTVQFTTAMELLGSLVKGQQQGTLEVRLAQYSKSNLLIVDELGYLPLEPQAGHLFFQLISRRYEQGSVLISSNRPVEEWDEVLGDQVVAQEKALLRTVPPAEGRNLPACAFQGGLRQAANSTHQQQRRKPIKPTQDP